MQAVPALNVCAIGAEISREQPDCGQFVFVQTKLRQSSTASNTEKCRQLPIEPIFVQPLASPLCLGPDFDAEASYLA